MAERLPVTFDGCAGALHGSAGARAVVILSPPGFEDLCAHRALDMLAQSLADAGLPTLRFDLPGTGDSLGDDADAGVVDRWLAAGSAAVDEARRLTGAGDIALVGLRLGALLAAQVAAARGDIARLALLAPPQSGKAYVRELKVLARVIAPLPPAPPEFAAPPSDGLALAGFNMSRETVEAIQRLAWPLEAPCADTLIAAARAGADLGAIALAWSAFGAKIARIEFDGYEKMMCDPTATATPLETLRAIADYVAMDRPARAAGAARAPETRLRGGAWIEEHILFGAAGALTGVLCRPAGAVGDRAIILTNAGGIRRIGWGRQTVDMARALACAGAASLRFDLSNVAGGADAAIPFHYGEDCAGEIIAAIDALEQRGHGAITLAGACSGAYHCMRAGLADARVSRLALINQLCFEWGPKYAFPLNAWMAQKSSDVERRRNVEDDELPDLARLRARLMAQAIKLAKTSAKGAFHALRAISAIASAAGERDGASGPELAFAALSARGARIDLVYADGDAGLGELERWFGPNGERALALPGVAQTIIPAADHLMTPAHARAMVLAVLMDGGARTGAATARRAGAA